jgi:D-proline reductase (dithiol) PrdB
MGTAADFTNAVWVQLFRRLPWLGPAWARRHRFVEVTDIPWTPLRKLVRESVVALVTTAGVHLKSQEPFDMEDPEGDPSFRVIPQDAPRADWTITHKYYDHSAADRDVNVVLPVDRLREFHQEGLVTALAPRAYGFMGHILGRHVTTLLEQTAPEVARRLKADGADAVVLTPA